MKYNKSICLNMIVRNESPVIRRCLKSVKPLIDYWVIVDTGSDDGTQEIIREEMQGILGELYERPWVDFSFNRTEALALAKGKGDYALLIDADEEVVMEEGVELPELTEQLYLVDVHLGLLAAYRELFVDNRLDWYWTGVLHEQICCKTELVKFGTLKGIWNQSHPDGARSRDPNKFLKELELLKKGLEEEPANSRYLFYLGQTHAACGHWQEALEAYQRRVDRGGWELEVYQSLYRIGLMQELLHDHPSRIVESYRKAHEFLPNRAEPLFRIAYQFYCCGEFQEAKRIASIGTAFPIPEAKYAFYMEPPVYQGWMVKLVADCCLALGEEKEALELYRALPGEPVFSSEACIEIQKNIEELRAQPGGLNSYVKKNHKREIKFQ